MPGRDLLYWGGETAPVDTRNISWPPPRPGRNLLLEPSYVFQAGFPGTKSHVEYVKDLLRNPEKIGQQWAEAIGPIMAPIAYHGSPYRFNKFSTKKIGTGQGAQMYGYGLYFAENKQVAMSPEYLARNAPDKFRGKKIISLMEDIESRMNRVDVNSPKWRQLQEKYQVFEDLALGKTHKDLLDLFDNAEYLPETRALVRSIKPKETSTHSLYKVDILPPSERFLDWDSPINEETASMLMQAIKGNKKFSIKEFEDVLGISDSYKGQPSDGKGIYGLIRDSLGSDKAASKWLASKGIPGIRYLDQGSREAGKGTYNYVVFNEADVKNLGIENDIYK